MDFKKKLKTRLYTAIIYFILGVTIIVGAFATKPNNDFISSFGLVLVVIGIARIRNYFIITKNEETITKRQIAETDERNISIANRAKSASFIIYVILASVSVIVLEIFNKGQLSIILSGTVCVFRNAVKFGNDRVFNTD